MEPLEPQTATVRSRFSRGATRTHVEASQEDADLLFHALNLGFVTVGALILFRLVSGRSSTRTTYTRISQLHAAGCLTRLPRETSSALSTGALPDLVTVEAGRVGVQADAGRTFDRMPEAEARRWAGIARADSKQIVQILASHGYDPAWVIRRLRQNTKNADKALRSIWNTTEHAILTSNLVAILAYAATTNGLTVDEIRGDNQLFLRHQYPTPDGATRKLLRTPDAFLVLRNGDTLQALIIETETGTASRKKVREKLETYMTLVDVLGGYDAFNAYLAKVADLDPAALRSVRVVVYSETDAHHAMVADVLSLLSPDKRAGMFSLIPASRVNLDIPADTLRKNLPMTDDGRRPTDVYRTLLSENVSGVVDGRRDNAAVLSYVPFFPCASDEILSA